MEYTTDTGAILTDADLETMAAEYESGEWSGVGPVEPGRPKLYDEDMETVSFRLPRSRIAAVEAVAKARGESKSEFFRKAIDEALLQPA